MPLKRIKDRRIIPISCDITNSAMLQSTIDSLDTPIDDFVNTIGTFLKKPVDSLSAEDIRQHFELNSIANITLTTLMLPKLRPSFSQILVCLATLALEAREQYSLQSATKASYKFFLDSLRKEIFQHSRVMMIHPSSVQTNIFKKAGDKRELSKYPSADVIAEMMQFMLSRPATIELRDMVVYNRS